MGRDRRIGAVDPDRRAHYRSHDRGNIGGDLEDQPAAGVIG
jgi:hypothetical protein